jgi:hypothetical protein
VTKSPQSTSTTNPGVRSSYSILQSADGLGIHLTTADIVPDLLSSLSRVTYSNRRIHCRRHPTSTYNVKCDESGATGDSDAIKKVSFDECMALKRKAEEDGIDREDARGLAGLEHMDCFVVSGSKILEGMGAMLLLLLGRRF